MKACFRKLMNREPTLSFIFKQLFGAFLGGVLAVLLGLSNKIYNFALNKPICKVYYNNKSTVGYFYKWTIQVKNKNQGSLLLYPKDDVLIMLPSIERPSRFIEAHNIGEHRSGNFSRGIRFIYVEGSNPMTLKFETYSDKLLNITNTKDATCGDLLSSL